MWKERLLTSLYSLSRAQLASIALFLLGFVLLSGGVLYSLHSSSSEKVQDITFESGSSVQSSQSTEQKITIDIEGAVISPGVYSLSSSSRIKDALIAAGGLSNNADRGWIEKNLNLALKLSDSAKVYIPKIGEIVVRSSNSSSGTVSSSGLMNINSASLSELDSLPGVGPATAQKIIDNRPYSKIDDLVSKKAVTSKIFEKIKDKISIY